MYKLRTFLDQKLLHVRRTHHCPSVGDTVRIGDDRYAKVTEVVWCFDEDSEEGDRVNLRLESEGKKG